MPFFLPAIISLMTIITEVVPAHAWVNPRVEKPTDIVSHTMEVEFSLSDHSMKARDVALFRTNGQREISFAIGDKASIASIVVSGGEAFWSHVKDREGRHEGLLPLDGKVVKVWLPGKGTPPEIVEVEIVYTYSAYDLPKVPAFSREFIADESRGLIGLEGIFLTPEGRWYPDVPGSTPTWRITTTTPAGYEVVAAGERIQREEKDGSLITTWDFPYPANDFHLVAGNYEITEGRLGPIKIYTYFYPEERDLAPQYIAAVKEYLEMYQNLLGKYPFTKFAVVANFFPTGYGMPSYTLLGRDVIRLPFIISTSLGHEIAHNWWGNSVYVDYKRGNWAEGLTTYNADHLYRERKGAAEAVDYRRQINIDYSNYVTTGRDFPLTGFTGRTTPATRAVGYGKSAMTFHMLRKLVGDVKFYEALRRVVVEYSYRTAGWGEIMQVFERTSDQGLVWFYRQWVEREGAPQLVMAPMKSRQKGSVFEVEVEVTQNGPGITDHGGGYLLDLPVKIIYEGGETIETRRIHETTTRLFFTVPGAPIRVVLDPNHDIFRRLGREEIPPMIGQVMGDNRQLFILPTGGSDEGRAAYEGIARQLARAGGVVLRKDTEVADGEWSDYSVILFGGPDENRLFSRLARNLPPGTAIGPDSFELNGRRYDKPGDFVLLTFRNPDNPAKAVMCLTGLSDEATSAAGRKITHYGKYSYLAFSDGVNQDKGVWDAVSVLP